MPCGALVRRVLAVCAALVLGACWADLDWRTVSPPGDGFSVMFPGRVSEESRALALLDGATMHQWSARARESVFAAGYADVPRVDAAIMARVRDALVANIAGRIESERRVSVGNLVGQEIRAAGEARGRPVRLRLALYAGDGRLYQVAMLGPPGDLSEEEADSFFASFRPGRPGGTQ